MERVALIVGSAPCQDWGFLQRYLRGGEYVVAADGGRLSLQQAGIRPDWYVGDGDSGGTPEGVSGTVLPVEKDWTDLEVAVHHAMEQGCRRLLLTGCTGGRFDHYYSACCLLEWIAQQGGSGLIVDGLNEIRYLAPGTHVIPNEPPYHYLGLLPLDRVVQGVTITGTKYPLYATDVPRTASLTISNEILPGQAATITLQAGSALLVRSVPEGQE
jgi:thiamine pyrophosphokinase